MCYSIGRDKFRSLHREYVPGFNSISRAERVRSLLVFELNGASITQRFFCGYIF